MRYLLILSLFFLSGCEHWLGVSQKAASQADNLIENERNTVLFFLCQGLGRELNCLNKAHSIAGVDRLEQWGGVEMVFNMKRQCLKNIENIKNLNNMRPDVVVRNFSPETFNKMLKMMGDKEENFKKNYTEKSAYPYTSDKEENRKREERNTELIKQVISFEIDQLEDFIDFVSRKEWPLCRETADQIR